MEPGGRSKRALPSGSLTRMFVAACWPAAAVFDAMVRRLTRAVVSRDPLDEGSSVRFFGGTPGQVRCCRAGGRWLDTRQKGGGGDQQSDEQMKVLILSSMESSNKSPVAVAGSLIPRALCRSSHPRPRHPTSPPYPRCPPHRAPTHPRRGEARRPKRRPPQSTPP